MKDTIFLITSFLIILSFQKGETRTLSYQTSGSNQVKEALSPTPTTPAIQDIGTKGEQLSPTPVKESARQMTNYPEVREYVNKRVADVFGSEHVEAFERLMNGESHYNPTAQNPNGGACGMFQAYPCSKLPCGLTAAMEDVECQVKWGLDYISRRYGNPTLAYAHWVKRVPLNGRDVGHWY